MNENSDWFEQAESSTDASVVNTQGNVHYPSRDWEICGGGGVKC